MIRVVLTSMAILFAFSSFPSLQSQEEKEEGVAWKTDLGKARAEAKESGKPLLIVFR